MLCVYFVLQDSHTHTHSLSFSFSRSICWHFSHCNEKLTVNKLNTKYKCGTLRRRRRCRCHCCCHHHYIAWQCNKEMQSICSPVKMFCPFKTHKKERKKLIHSKAFARNYLRLHYGLHLITKKVIGDVEHFFSQSPIYWLQNDEFFFLPISVRRDNPPERVREKEENVNINRSVQSMKYL